MHTYIIDTQATVMEIDGEQWLIILNTFDYGSPEARHLASEAFYKLDKLVPNVITGMKRDDGTYGFACSLEHADKIRARLLPNHPWKKFRLHPLPNIARWRQVAL